MGEKALSPPPSLVGPETIEELVAIARDTPAGAFLEVGVFQGGTAWHLWMLARELGRNVYLFDTFRGMPYAEHGLDSHKVGDLSGVDASTIQRSMPGAIVVEGVFPESAVDLELPPLSFVHLDCDQYRSVKESALYLKDLVVHGGVIWLDDSPCLPGALKAAGEVFGDQLLLSRTNKHYVRVRK
jgi:O-methyltransferase